MLLQLTEKTANIDISSMTHTQRKERDIMHEHVP